MDIIIYSVNIGDYDIFKIPKNCDKNARYILFTDNKHFKSKVWEVNHIEFLPKNLDSRKKARYLKINSHLVLPKHDVSIWIDHGFEPKISNSVDFLNKIKFSDSNVMCYKHRVRNCIYQEGEKVKELKYDNNIIVDKQLNKYRSENFPQNYGLFETGFMIRKLNNNVITFNNFWWDEIENSSGRDQLSQMYTSWKTGIKISPITVGKSVYNNEFVNGSGLHEKKFNITEL